MIVAVDNDDMRELLVESLDLAGITAHGVATLAEARARLAEVKADVLLADYELPDGTGTDLLAAACAAPQGRPKLCILLTGYDAVDVETTGFDLVMTKPVDFRKVVDAIRASK